MEMILDLTQRIGRNRVRDRRRQMGNQIFSPTLRGQVDRAIALPILERSPRPQAQQFGDDIRAGAQAGGMMQRRVKRIPPRPSRIHKGGLLAEQGERNLPVGIPAGIRKLAPDRALGIVEKLDTHPAVP
jgi:hypothetical protein